MKPRTRIAVVGAVVVFLSPAAGCGHLAVYARRPAPPTIIPNVVQAPAQEAPLRAAVAANPKDPQARWALARFYQQSGKPDQAIQQLDSLRRMLPPDSPAQIPLANAWLTLKRGERAEPTFRRLTDLQPNNESGWQGLALSLYQQQRYYEATHAAWRANQLAPNDLNGQYVLGTSALAYAKQFPNNTHDDEMNLARQQFQRLVQAWPSNPEVFYKLGQTDISLGDADQAILHLRRAWELSPRPDVASELAHAYAVKGDTATARQTVEAALARDPNDAALHDQRGQLLQDTDSAQALTEYQMANRLAPNSSRFMERLAAAYLRAGRLPEAQAAFQKMIRLNPSRTFPYQQMAIIETRLGHTAAAAHDAHIAARKNAESQSLLHLQTQSSLHPENIALHLQLAAQFQALGLAGDARDERLAAAHLRPGNTPIRSGQAALKVPLPQ